MPLNINIQELIAAELAIKTFTKDEKRASIHIKIDNMAALSYILNMGGTKNWDMLVIAKRIWEYLLAHQIAITAEWIPTHLNTIADWESRHVPNSIFPVCYTDNTLEPREHSIQQCFTWFSCKTNFIGYIFHYVILIRDGNHTSFSPSLLHETMSEKRSRTSPTQIGHTLNKSMNNHICDIRHVLGIKTM